jgi:thiol-disulfide isomerase/thioredoxin
MIISAGAIVVPAFRIQWRSNMCVFPKYILTASFFFAGTLTMAGCSQPEPAPSKETPALEQPAAEATPPAPEATVEVVAPAEPEAALESEVPPTPEAPPAANSETTSEVPLPEVRAVNTAQFGELVEGTLGKVTVLNIWATWCGPCVQEMPDLVKFYNETSRDTVAFLSLSIDAESEITGAIPEFQRTHKVPFPVYVLNERNDEGLEKALRIPFKGGIPATYVYDATGKLVMSELGAITLAELQAVVIPLVQPAP